MESGQPTNLLLESLPPRDLEEVMRHLEQASLQAHAVLVEPGQPISNVYFPIDCMVSVVTILDDGSSIESATIGNEGMAGLPVFHGLEVATSRSVAQMEGTTWRMNSDDLRDLVSRVPSLRAALANYTDTLISMLAQSGACNGLHNVEQRFARWLLTIQDRVHRDEFMITQEFLAQMLGTHRPTVTIAAGVLQKAGFITYRHGHVRILDRESLEGVTCECYEIIRALYSRRPR